MVMKKGIFLLPVITKILSGVYFMMDSNILSATLHSNHGCVDAKSQIIKSTITWFGSYACAESQYGDANCIRWLLHSKCQDQHTRCQQWENIQEKNCSCSQYHILCVYVYKFVHIEGIHFNVFLHLKFSVVLSLNRCCFGLGLQQEVSGWRWSYNVWLWKVSSAPFLATINAVIVMYLSDISYRNDLVYAFSTTVTSTSIEKIWNSC